MPFGRPDRDPERPVYVISVAASILSVHPRTLRIYEDEGLVCPARTPTNIRLYSEQDIRRVLWIRHLTQNLGVNLAGVRILFELEERLGARILEALYDEGVRAGLGAGAPNGAAADGAPRETAGARGAKGGPVRPAERAESTAQVEPTRAAGTASTGPAAVRPSNRPGPPG